jgi:hypothetical protein
MRVEVIVYERVEAIVGTHGEAVVEVAVALADMGDAEPEPEPAERAMLDIISRPEAAAEDRHAGEAIADREGRVFGDPRVDQADAADDVPAGQDLTGQIRLDPLRLLLAGDDGEGGVLWIGGRDVVPRDPEGGCAQGQAGIEIDPGTDLDLIARAGRRLVTFKTLAVCGRNEVA